MNLTDDEAEALDALAALEQLLHAVHVQPISQRIAAAVRRIETRLGLAAGAIGSTHVVTDGRVVAKPEH